MTSAAERDDVEARRLALTALDRTLLVEAGAGSGKTSVLAGRVVALMAAGADPRSIAAITFTELAASELRERIVRFTDEVIRDAVPPDLRQAFPDGVAADRRAALARARGELDALSCSTIHSFCQTLLTPYPVEADMDPGATVMDRQEADALFAQVLDDAFCERLSVPVREDDALVAFFLAEPVAARALVTAFAARLRGRPELRAPSHADEKDARDAVRASVRAFRAFVDGAPCREPGTELIVVGLETMARELTSDPEPAPAEVLRLLRLAVPEACAVKSGGFAAYRCKGRWQAAAKAASTLAEATRLNDEATACYEACKVAHAALRGWAATRALQLIEGDCRTIVASFARLKREKAKLDFDDLLLKTRDLLRDRADVRDALATRFTSVLVDEFQDTDPLQVEILWRLAASAPHAGVDAAWRDVKLRPGSLFLVGDPKQAIYRFRGADIASYQEVRERLRTADAGSVVAITRNFRSVPGILDWVNRTFEGPLGAAGQPGFAPLFAAVEAIEGMRPVEALPVAADSGVADDIRDAEAEAVADLCNALIASQQVRERGVPRACTASDIALLAPTGTDLWRYERALEERGIAVSTQAGKGFFRRQEVHDMIALARALADSRDRVALGALLRGPLVGLTEEELLDAASEAAAASDCGHGRLDLWTPVEGLSHPLLRETMSILQGLARRSGSTTPYVLLCAAVEEMQVRPIVRRRRVRTAERALANVDLFLELARPYDITGLRAFAARMRQEWEGATRSVEARPDTARPAVSLITMHSSKGLEWPVVIPINAATAMRSSVASAVTAATSSFQMAVFDNFADGGASAIEEEKDELARERHRLWYVAATRARELLVLPKPSCGRKKGWWLELIGAGVDAVDIVEPLTAAELQTEETVSAGPSAEAFRAQADAIRAAARTVRRITPHLAEAGDIEPGGLNLMPPGDEAGGASSQPVRGGRERGLILHKLIEEVLTGETMESETPLTERAATLRAELDVDCGTGPDPAEMARAVLRGLSIPEVAAVRRRLVPECSVLASRDSGSAEEVTFGVADAVALDHDGLPALVIDWKSDIDPAPEAVAAYRGQVLSYLHATGAGEGLIVFLTTGAAERVEAIPKSRSAALEVSRRISSKHSMKATISTLIRQ